MGPQYPIVFCDIEGKEDRGKCYINIYTCYTHTHSLVLFIYVYTQAIVHLLYITVCDLK